MSHVGLDKSHKLSKIFRFRTGNVPKSVNQQRKTKRAREMFCELGNNAKKELRNKWMKKSPEVYLYCVWSYSTRRETWPFQHFFTLLVLFLRFCFLFFLLVFKFDAWPFEGCNLFALRLRYMSFNGFDIVADVQQVVFQVGDLFG